MAPWTTFCHLLTSAYIVEARKTVVLAFKCYLVDIRRTFSSSGRPIQKIAPPVGYSCAHIPVFRVQKIFNILNECRQESIGKNNRIHGSPIFAFDNIPSVTKVLNCRLRTGFKEWGVKHTKSILWTMTCGLLPSIYRLRASSTSLDSASTFNVYMLAQRLSFSWKHGYNTLLTST